MFRGVYECLLVRFVWMCYFTLFGFAVEVIICICYFCGSYLFIVEWLAFVLLLRLCL